MVIIGQMIARGEGSTMKRKNVRSICGHPMIYWTLKHAMDSGFIDHIYVFTEDPEIAQITESIGCKAVKRPKDMVFYNSGFSNPNEWWPYFQDKIKEDLGTSGDIIVNLNCNVCLLSGESLRQMYIKLMEDELAVNVFPVVEVEPHLYIENPATGYLFPIWDDPGLDRQKFPRLFRRVGVSVTHTHRQASTNYQKCLHHEVPTAEAMDIHDEDDLLIAEAFLKRRLK